MTAMPAVDAPGPRTVSAMLGMRRDGFLDHVGHLWRTHGDTFALRIGLRTLVFAMHPDAVRHVNVTERRMYDKERSYDTVRKYLTGDGLVASTGALWKRQRKLMAPFFTPRAVREYAETILRDGVRLSDRWDALARDGVRVDMGEEMMRVTAAIILRALFSTEADEAVVDLKGKVETMIAYTTDRAQGLPVPDWVPTRARRRYVTARDSVHASINGMIAERRGLAESAWPDDLLTRLMRARDDAGAAMTEALLRDESLTMFFAGHETTARTLNAAWFALARHPEVASRLHAELDQLGDRTPTASDLDRLPYMLQVVKETLRLYPPAPFYARDALADDVLDGFRVPAGAAVMLSPYYTHRHPGFWDDPEVFDPDRWTPSAEAGRHPTAYHPFATGLRVCIGNHFSLLESHLLLATLARRFEARLEPGFEPRWEMHGVLTTNNGMPMVIARR